MRERVDLKSPVREYRPPGSVRGAPGNRRPYRDSKSTTTGVNLDFTPHPCPSPHAAIGNPTEAWGEGAALSAPVESVRMAIASARTRVVQPHLTATGGCTWLRVGKLRTSAPAAPACEKSGLEI
jgi:hypothetical protein